MTPRPTDDGRSSDTAPLTSPALRQQRAGVVRGEVLLHSGALDLVSAAGVMVGYLFLLLDLGDASETGRPLLAVVAGVLVLRGLVRLGNYWNT